MFSEREDTQYFLRRRDSFLEQHPEFGDSMKEIYQEIVSMADIPSGIGNDEDIKVKSIELREKLSVAQKHLDSIKTDDEIKSEYQKELDKLFCRAFWNYVATNNINLYQMEEPEEEDSK